MTQIIIATSNYIDEQQNPNSQKDVWGKKASCGSQSHWVGAAAAAHVGVGTGPPIR